jgi:hypothetical protein
MYVCMYVCIRGGPEIRLWHRVLQWSIVLPLLINPLLILHFEGNVGLYLRGVIIVSWFHKELAQVTKLILSSYLRLGILNGFFRPSIPISVTVYMHFSYLVSNWMPSLSYPPEFYYPRSIQWRMKTVKLLTVGLHVHRKRTSLKPRR